jgi:hypothetical protein
MNECHPSIRSNLLPIHPLDTETQRRRMGEGLEGAQTPHPTEFADGPEMPSPTRGEGATTAGALAANPQSALP